MELEGVVAALTTDTADATATEGRRQVTHEERVDPHQARADRTADPLGALARRRVNTIADNP